MQGRGLGEEAQGRALNWSTSSLWCCKLPRKCRLSQWRDGSVVCAAAQQARRMSMSGRPRVVAFHCL